MDSATVPSSKVLLGGHKWVVRYNTPHILMLHEEEVFSGEDSAKLLTGLRDIQELGVETKLVRAVDAIVKSLTA
jgi:hypothetical protein